MITSISVRSQYRSIYESQMLDVNDVAFLIKSSTRWVYAHKKEIPGLVEFGGNVRFKKSEVLRWLGLKLTDIQVYLTD